MATTDFFTCPKRTVYQRPITDPAVPKKDSLIPSTENVNFFQGTNTGDVVFDFGENPPAFSHVYIKHNNIEMIEMSRQDSLAPGSPNDFTFDPFDVTDSPSMVYTNRTSEKHRYLRFHVKKHSGQPMLFSIVPMNLIVRFGEVTKNGTENGAFNEISFIPEHRTRGHHRMMKGGLKPFQGLGIEKRKMSFGSDYIPYTYIPKPILIPQQIGIGDAEYNTSLKIYLNEHLSKYTSYLENIDWYFPLVLSLIHI